MFDPKCRALEKRLSGIISGLRMPRALPLLLGLILLGHSTSAWAQRQHQVLVLYSTRPDAEVVSIGERELPRILAKGLSGQLDYYAEFIDQSRLAPDYPDVFREYLRRKYAMHTIELLIAMDAGALDFVTQIRRDFFSSIPIVFFSSQPSPPRPPNATGINAPINLRDTVSLAVTLQPDLRQIFVITGADRSYERLARAELRRYEGKLSIIYLAALATADLEKRLASLPAGSMVYYVHVTRDGANANFNALDYLDRIVAVANAPTYSWTDTTIGRGVVGGSVRSLTAQMEAVGRLALRVLSGEAADSIPIAQPDLNVREVDWRQLRRWGISERRVPSGALVRFRQPSAWELYGVYIVAGALVLAGQAMMIATLLIQRQRRQRAEQHARKSDAALRTSYERIRDLGGRLLGAQEAERRKIAQELHDDVSQHLVLLMMELHRLGHTDALNRAHLITRTVHDLSHRLHPEKLSLLGLPAAIRSLQSELSPGNAEIRFAHADVPAQLPANVRVGMYRVAQEALQNAVKYSQAAHIQTHLGWAGGTLTLTIEDDGVGFDVDAAWGKGLGLISMRERVQAMGGTFEIQSTANGGTRVSVSVPLYGAAVRVDMEAVRRDHASPPDGRRENAVRQPLPGSRRNA